jgi:hypothetical protein
MVCLRCSEALSAPGRTKFGEHHGQHPTLFIFDSNNGWTGSHHVEPGEFFEAVESLCYICLVIFRDCSKELRKQARAFRTYYKIRRPSASTYDNGVDGDRYDLEFMIEILQGTTPIVKRQAFSCKGTFKILPTSGTP